MINISLDIAKIRFNERPVLSAKDKGTRDALKRAGARVRGAARASMKRRVNKSEPGQPPRVVNGDLKKYLFFFVDKAIDMTAGPLSLSGSTVPGLLEYGGRSTPRKRKGIKKPGFYEARPYMNPALRKIAPSVPELFKNAFK